MKVFITGGTGYIGGRVVAALLKRGDRVHLLCRSRSALSSLPAGDVRIHFGDILNSASIAAAMEGCDGVIHLAGYAKNWASDPSVYDEVNVQGTRNVLEAAFELRVRKVVCVSSIVVFGPSNGRPLDERTKRSAGFYTEYERTKYLADALREEFLSKGLPLVSIYPTRVYGPGKATEGNSFSRILHLYLRGKFPLLLDAGRQIANYVYVEDLVSGILLSLDKGKPGKKYILGGENASLAKIFDRIDAIARRKHLRVPVPALVARGISKIAELNARLFGIYPAITPGWVETFLQDWAASSELAEKELGYRITPLKIGLERTVTWLRAQEEME